MATILQAYNGALAILGDAALATVSDATASRYYLDAAYATAIDHCLLQANWSFAARKVEVSADTDYTAGTGEWLYRFDKPTDLIRTITLATDSTLQNPLERFEILGSYVYADMTPLYWSYVSNGASYGGLLTSWPTHFLKVVQHHLAVETCAQIKGDGNKKQEIYQWYKKYLDDAKSQNAYENPVKTSPVGRFVRSRGYRSRED
jgi:hypothetical protein